MTQTLPLFESPIPQRGDWVRVDCPNTGYNVARGEVLSVCTLSGKLRIRARCADNPRHLKNRWSYYLGDTDYERRHFVFTIDPKYCEVLP